MPIDQQQTEQTPSPQPQNPWSRAYADFIAVYNATLERDGLPLEEWRSF